MTIPDDAIQRAAEAMYDAIDISNSAYGDQGEVYRHYFEFQVLAAIPILREAILESIIADVERKRVFFGTPTFPYDITEELASFLRAYITESEPQP